MVKLLIAALLVFPPIVFAEDIKCPKGYQPYANRCVTQRMADYISCVEASGGNRQEIIEEVSEIGGQKASTGIKASGSGAIVKGSGSLLMDKASEKALAKKLETQWFPKGMSECSKILDKATVHDIKKSTLQLPFIDLLNNAQLLNINIGQKLAARIVFKNYGSATAYKVWADAYLLKSEGPLCDPLPDISGPTDHSIVDLGPGLDRQIDLEGPEIDAEWLEAFKNGKIQIYVLGSFEFYDDQSKKYRKDFCQQYYYTKKIFQFCSFHNGFSIIK